MKKLNIIIILAFCLIGTNSFAQNAQVSESFYSINDFSSMMKSHMSDDLVEKGSAKQAINVRPNIKFGNLTKRPEMFLLTTTPDSAIKSLYRYYKADDTKYTIASYGTKVSYYDDSGTEIILSNYATSGKRWTFVTYKDFLIGMNGTDRSKQWDSKVLITPNTDAARTANDLMADLGAPFVELNTGAHLDASKWYQYKIAYCSDETCTASASFTYSDSRSNPILTGADVRDITLTDIPLGPSGTKSRYIYRTLGNATRAAVIADTTFYKVLTIANNIDITDDDDMTDDIADGDAVPSWETVSGGTEVSPPHGKFALINTERLFIANDPSSEYQSAGGKSTIYWSDVLNPNYFNALVDYELVRPDDGDEITFIKNVLGLLTIGKTRTINKFYTTATSSENWVLQDPISHIGCIAPYSVVNAQSGLIYLSRYGIFSFNGQTASLVSDVVTDKTRDILSTNIEDVVGVYHDNRYLMAYTSSESGSAINDKVLILDSVRNSYYEDTKNIDSFAMFDSGDDFGTLYSGSSATDGNIYAHKNEFNRLTYRYKSQLDEGTKDSVRVGGIENNPWIKLGSDETWAESTDKWEDSGLKTWMVTDLTGKWYSPVIQVDATEYDQLYWNEKLGVYGNATFAIRSAATSGGIAGASWSSEFTDPTGSDVSGLTANDYLQLRASLASTVYTETPELYLSDSFVMKLSYKKEGTTAESSILSIWESGETTFEGGESPKAIKEMQVYYQGTSGTLNIKYSNLQGDNYDFDIDLSVNPDDSNDDSYFGTNTDKIYVHIPPFDNVPTGRRWTFLVSENGTVGWSIKSIKIRNQVNSYTTFK